MMKTSAIVAAAITLAACGPGAEGDALVAGKAAGPGAEATARPAAVRPETKQFREWYAVCDNGNRCAAYTGSDAEGGWLMVRMDAGGEARPQLLAGLSAFSGDDEVKGLRLVLDGKARTLGAGNRDSGSPLPASEVRAALTDLAAARTVSVQMGDTQGALPAAGAAAALLWIDERQGRLGTTTALIRRGDRPASSVPAAPALPEVTVANAAKAPVSQSGLEGATNPMDDGDTAGVPLPAAVQAVPAVKACRAETGYNEYLQKAVLAARLEEGVELWGVPCSSGAYNASYALYVTGTNGAKPRLAEFPTWQARPEAETLGEDWLVNPVYDVATRTLSHFPRGRGIGDCGVRQSWTWTGGAFVLKEERVMGECWGMSSNLWPTTWRSR